jgi:hypothetical protein
MQPVQNLNLLEGWKLNQINVAGLKLQAVKISLIESYSFLGFKKPRFSNYDTLRNISLWKIFLGGEVSWTINSSICVPLLKESAHEGMPSMNICPQAS